jgi:uncharacterized cupredoxin-like copper-binding protein
MLCSVACWPSLSDRLSLTLGKKGKYEFLCTVPGHAGAGMKGLIGVGVSVGASAAATSSATPAAQTSPAPAAGASATQASAQAAATPNAAPATAATAPGTCTSPQSSAVTVSAFDLGYTLSSSTIPCGTVTFTMTNDGDTQHDFLIDRPGGGGSRLLAPGERVSFTVSIPPGTWTYYCSFPNHRTLGMEGKLTVTG